MPTPAGLLKFSADGAVVRLRVEPAQHRLPRQVHVQGCQAVRVAWQQASSLLLRAEWVPVNAMDASPESGEHLEAQVWRGGGFVVALGTGDEAWLQARLRRPALTAEARYAPLSMELAIHGLPPGPGQLCWRAAWNPDPEPAPDACWLAVGLQDA